MWVLIAAKLKQSNFQNPVGKSKRANHYSMTVCLQRHLLSRWLLLLPINMSVRLVRHDAVRCAHTVHTLLHMYSSMLPK